MRSPGLRWLRRDPRGRWRRIAVRYRGLAVELGGVLIKLGQYLSTRVDLLPSEVTRELKGLQDEVPAVSFALIAAEIERELGGPLGELFAAVESEPLGAASLAQVHAARLISGEEVVLKVLRPGIDVLVETDLAAVGLALGWLKGWRFVHRRVDLDALIDEFQQTTRRELDLRSEGTHAERFAECFAEDPRVYIPSIYWSTSSRRVLTEENVAFIKVDDAAALEAAGIDPRELAKQLYQVYMEQVFVHNFVHADPHPGNLFVRPLPGSNAGEPSFQIVFVDFGMVAEIPERLRASLRKFLVGLGSRDASLVIRACVDSGLLLPGADLIQLEEALEQAFDKFWGADVSRLNNLVKSEAAALLLEFRQLILETPIQIQTDLTFTGRAIELLTGLTTGLDAEFNPWLETLPFAERLAGEFAAGWSERLRDLLVDTQRLSRLPSDLGQVAAQASRGRLVVRASLAPDSRRQLRRMEKSIDGLGNTMAASAALIAGALFYPHERWLAFGLLGLALVLWGWNLLRRWFG